MAAENGQTRSSMDSSMSNSADIFNLMDNLLPRADCVEMVEPDELQRLYAGIGMPSLRVMELSGQARGVNYLEIREANPLLGLPLPWALATRHGTSASYTATSPSLPVLRISYRCCPRRWRPSCCTPPFRCRSGKAHQWFAQGRSFAGSQRARSGGKWLVGAASLKGFLDRLFLRPGEHKALATRGGGLPCAGRPLPDPHYLDICINRGRVAPP